MNTIKLGQCPFCGGRVTAALEKAGGMLMAGLPECENGCPVGPVVPPAALTAPASNGAGRLADEWARACETLLNPKPCPACGGQPVFAAVDAVLRFGCPDDGTVKAVAGMSLVGLVEEWNERARAAADRLRRQSELEAECAILNRAYWPDRLKDDRD